ncbi:MULTISPECIES: ferredoxin--NADP reductase [unclassified Crossiella]|uniref:ferredoxin--NADP reductase n=1 Tax=unclassified Crossiella TaxID=2620835 RepID=UPI001FFE4D36|nr:MULTISPECIES: ferredoxin--NADP reductase [unclassified Crossiella]MCK2239523.1 ferredoxin--NADP reductase [Crossiella sp. S99.2]MCK2252218.1 ferredoxin--NADP reductase [Crossiella sp. S99.1]
MADRGHRLRVSTVVSETADARTLVFEVPPELAEVFRHRPGQFLTLRIPGERGEIARSYSLCNGPGEPPAVTVKRVAQGYGSNWLCDRITAGAELDVLPPAGVFTPPSLDEDLALFAGGSGITPVISIIKAVLAHGSGRLTLFYANRDEHSVIFAARLRALGAAHPDRLRVLHWLESVQGLPTVPALRAFAAPLTGHRVFLCGPGPFMTAVLDALSTVDIPDDRIHREIFLSLSDNPFAAAPEADADAAVVEVDLDGDTHTLPWPRERKLLDVLLDHGLAAPYSCRAGACSACACRLLDGKVTLANNEVLDEEDLAEGIILACQALPAADSVRISYE